MRTKFYSALLTLGLAATALARAGHAGVPAPISPSMELVIDTSLRPTELHFTRSVQPNSIWNIVDAIDFGADDFTDFNLALSSPGLLFGMPYEFFGFSVRFGSAGAATTGVLFPIYQNKAVLAP